ncbi:MAG: 2-oxoacid:acceptor oxidoreductase family protein [Bacteroidetes bacterium]|nr:2-oxoacid:acceptor oxidoreductase family protein [Bacteroidota bacterium]
MANFKDFVDSPINSKFILQGNQAFALGVVHSGYHCVDGYPGTPSTEVIDKSLAYVQDKIKVGWDVNEAVAVAVGVGHAIAGFDSVVTMKTPGAFQAGDAITTSAFYHAPAGAFVLFVATDYVPSSTQHVIDLRHLFASARIPVLEPRNHQEMYEMPWHAADISRQFNTPVVILASGILCHSEGLISTKQARTITPRELPKDLKSWMGMPNLARKAYNFTTQQRIPQVREWAEKSELTKEFIGSDDWGLIVTGESNIIVNEVLGSLGLNPSILSIANVYPLPEKRIKAFAEKISGNLFVIEDGDKFVEDKIKLLGINIIGKDEDSVITEWTPELVIEFLSKHINIDFHLEKTKLDITPVMRPPAICPGCPYRAFGLTVQKLRKQNKIYTGFGDIGCSTLLSFLNAIDTCLCMGASDSMRQGFVLSRPEYAHRTISVLGDSCECHSGLDSTRNAVFRNTPGVKVILDNSITAMTGGQPAPTTKNNLAGIENKFDLVKAEQAEAARVVTVDSYNMKDVEAKLIEALDLSEKGEFTTLILQGPCVNQVESKKKQRTLTINYDKCKKCGKCNICPGIELDENKTPHFTNFCTNCGGNTPVCMQRCPFDAFELIQEEKKEKRDLKIEKYVPSTNIDIDKEKLPKSIRLAIRGIGGQGNLFFGKVLAEVAMNTPYADTHIVKGDTHGMAQLGGPVISTFSCGDVYSSTLVPASADVLVVMEMSEILRPDFLDLLKPQGTILLNKFRALPPNTKMSDYPDYVEIKKSLSNYNVIEIDGNEICSEIGDKQGKSANIIVLGLLSTIKPFNCIPKEVWLNALMKLSPNDVIKTMNKLAFEKGINYEISK